MKMPRKVPVWFMMSLGMFLLAGCVTPPPKLKHIAVTRPNGPIQETVGNSVTLPQSRNGFYFLNFGFRPPPDISDYLCQAHKAASSECLKNADVRMCIPFAVDVLLFGFQFGTDHVTANN